MSSERIVFDKRGLTIFYDDKSNLHIKTSIDSKIYTPEQQTNLRLTITNIENNRIHLSAFISLLVLCLIGSWCISFKLLPLTLLVIPIIPILINLVLGVGASLFLFQTIKCSFFLVIDYKDKGIVKMDTLKYGTISTIVSFGVFINEFMETIKKEARDISVVKFP